MKMSKNARSAMERIVTIVVLVGLALAVLWGSIVLIWRGAQLVSPDAARVWALLATAALPIAVMISWQLGHTEARGRMAGLDQGVNKMMGALGKAADLRVGTMRAVRRTEMPSPPAVVLPDVQIVQRVLAAGDVVEL